MKYFIAGFLGFFIPLSIAWSAGLDLFKRSLDLSVAYGLGILLCVLLVAFVDTFNPNGCK